MGNSKIVYGNTTLIDLTGDTVDSSKLLKGATAHGADGEPIVGAADMDSLVPNSGNTAIVDSDVIVTKEASGGNWYKKTFSLVWNYIKGKIGISAQGSTGKYLDEQGNFTTPPNTTYGVVSKTSDGLAPQLPNETSTDKYLRQDGTWAVPPDTIGTYDSTARSYASDALANEAATYSSSTAYSVGQFVKYNNITYECIKATSAGTAPTNTTYWTEKKLGNKLSELNSALYKLNAPEFISHNIPRLIPKDITAYMADGSFWKRLNGTDGYSLFEDIFVGDYVKMSRAITAPNQDSQYAITGSQYITLIGLDTRMGDGDGGDSVSVISYHHSIWTAGQGFGGTQHFGRKRMNSSNVTTGGYVSSEMFIATIGAVVSSGSTASGATINQQLYAEFGSHLKKTRELLTNAMEGTRYNRFGQASGASSNWAWTTCQAVLMSEVEVYGSTVWSSSGYDTGNANKQFPLFVFSKEAMNNRSAYYWLKDLASGAHFCRCNNFGGSSYGDASNAYTYVRPRFILA